MTFIEAVKQNNQDEFFRILKLQTDFSEKRVIEEVDVEYEGNALYWTAACGHLHFIEPLIKAGADVNKADNLGWTPVYIAAHNGHAEIITALKAAGADVNTPNDSGTTSVCAAAYNGHAAVIAALKAAGANVNTPEINGLTPLYIAAQMGDVKVISTLLEAGANATIKTPHGTPLEQAKQGTTLKDRDIVRLLEDHLKQYPNGIKIAISKNKVELHFGSTAEVKEKTEKFSQKSSAILQELGNIREANAYLPGTDYNPAPKVVVANNPASNYNPSTEYRPKPKTEHNSNNSIGQPPSLSLLFTAVDNPLETLKRRAASGEPKAQNELGEHYYYGRGGVSQSYAKALEWFMKAANQNEALAQFNVGNCFYKGEGVALNYKEAVEWYTKAAMQGEVDAQNVLGNCYKKGKGEIAKDLGKAIYWFREAANRNYAPAQFNLGACYQTGEGVTQNYCSAVEWYTKAAAQNHTESQYWLGLCYEKGWGVTQDSGIASQLYNKAMLEGHQLAQQRLERLRQGGMSMSSLPSNKLNA